VQKYTAPGEKIPKTLFGENDEKSEKKPCFPLDICALFLYNDFICRMGEEEFHGTDHCCRVRQGRRW
jgi:hypothetical protein